MRKVILLLFIASVKHCSGQVAVSNQSPTVSDDFIRYLYVGYENPVIISTGGFTSLNVSVNNGTITKTDIKGRYILKPTTMGTAIITLSGKNYKKEFKFNVRSLGDPKIKFSGPGDEGIVYIRQSDGIYAYHQPADVDLMYRIDSFTLEITDSVGQKSTHVNIGPAWDEVSRKRIRETTPKSFVLVYNVYMSGPGGRRWRSQSYLEGYIW